MLPNETTQAEAEAEPKTIESIIRDYVTRNYPNETEITLETDDIDWIFHTIKEDIEGIEWSTNREPSDAGEAWVDLIYTTEDKEGDTMSIHMFEIEWINAVDIDGIIKEISDIVTKCNNKCKYLEALFVSDYMTVDNFNNHITQGDTIGTLIFDRLATIFDKKTDPYNPDNGIDFHFKEGHPNEGENIISVLDNKDGTYFIDYID